MFIFGNKQWRQCIWCNWNPVAEEKTVFDSYENSILISVVNECALTMENPHNAIEKEKNAVLAKNEQLRADLLRAISHDLRTPLCSISGNADMLLNNGNCLDETNKTADLCGYL